MLNAEHRKVFEEMVTKAHQRIEKNDQGNYIDKNVRTLWRGFKMGVKASETIKSRYRTVWVVARIQDDRSYSFSLNPYRHLSELEAMNEASRLTSIHQARFAVFRRIHITSATQQSVVESVSSAMSMDDVFPDYQDGHCHVLAIALHQRYGYDLYAIAEDREYPDGAALGLIHAYCLTDMSDAVDASGMIDVATMHERYLPLGNNPMVMRLTSEELWWLAEGDVAIDLKAITRAHRYIDEMIATSNASVIFKRSNAYVFA